MTFTTANTHQPHAGFILNLRTALRDAQSRRARERSIRAELDDLSDRELADIGISRHQINDVARGSVSR